MSGHRVQNEVLAKRLEEWIPSCGAEVPIQLEHLLLGAVAALRSASPEARGDGLDCPECGHPWAAHDLTDYRDSAGRIATGTAPLIEVCTAGSGKELGPDDHPLEAACGCIRTYWPAPSNEGEGARVDAEDLELLRDLRDNFAEQGSEPNPGPCELDAAKDAAALTRVIAALSGEGEKA